MDIISQLQEQVNTIAAISFNTFGTLQRDAPPDSLESLVLCKPIPPSYKPKYFDALVTALPLSEGGEEAQLKRIAELQAENDLVGQELQKQLEAAEIISLVKLCTSDSLVKHLYSNICFCASLEVVIPVGCVDLVQKLADSKTVQGSILAASKVLQFSNNENILFCSLLLAKWVDCVGSGNEKELKQVQELFNEAADNCLNMKKPDS
ncbi:mediator of RNA polymerase II transcription subunit 21 [Artemisia annua]|uniref:Mediator of RNA polymerase II transcription subunit 21 n=1 Tax=Artemisia annua TaxID=35608 RepID=A0A2U1ND61_ARTAN|nr:mediator of RNA polymerase II transcription subunit 21 [Artemisia annua]